MGLLLMDFVQKLSDALDSLPCFEGLVFCIDKLAKRCDIPHPDLLRYLSHLVKKFLIDGDLLGFRCH